LTNNVYDTGNAEVHNTMMRTNDGNLSVNKYDAANSACIACHTHVDVEITYTRPTTLTFDANEGIDGTWVLNNYGVGPNTTVTHD